MFVPISERRKQDDAIEKLNKGLKEAEEVQQKYEQYSTGLKEEIENQKTEISALREGLMLQIAFHRLLPFFIIPCFLRAEEKEAKVRRKIGRICGDERRYFFLFQCINTCFVFLRYLHNLSK